MSKNLAIPYLLQLKDGVNAIHLTEVADVNSVEDTVFLENYKDAIGKFTQIVDSTVQIETDPHSNKEIVNYVYEVVYPDQLDLKPVLKRGRPRKKNNGTETQTGTTKAKPPILRTRSGRPVKFPKHIERYFKKVEWDENPDAPEELKLSEFTSYEEEQPKPALKEQMPEQPTRKRKISTQYRCPKCKKAYLGKTKMMLHIKKYPDHGPIPVPHNGLNFEVWNYLVDVTQKCPPARRGIKFCEELTNLLHNVLLLTSALFKKVELNKNHVEVDKVLGNAIGIPPGLYKFNETELHKDVTVLKLITNTDFFKPCGMADTHESGSIVGNVHGKNSTCDNSQNITKDVFFDSRLDNIQYSNKDFCLDKVQQDSKKLNIDHQMNQSKVVKAHNNIVENPTGKHIQHYKLTNGIATNVVRNSVEEHISLHNEVLCGSTLLNIPPAHLMLPNLEPLRTSDRVSEDNLKINMIVPPCDNLPENICKRNTELQNPSAIAEVMDQDIKKPSIEHNELLSQNPLLHLPNLRNSVDDLMLPTVDTSGALLDNSTSSDEVMNVDQFVNERFKNITEPDMEPSLNLDLSTMELFNFNTS